MLHDAARVLKKHGPRLQVGVLAESAPKDAVNGVSQTKEESKAYPDIAAYYNPDTKGVMPSETQSWNSGGTAAILPREREKASFEVRLHNIFRDHGWSCLLRCPGGVCRCHRDS